MRICHRFVGIHVRYLKQVYVWKLEERQRVLDRGGAMGYTIAFTEW